MAEIVTESDIRNQIAEARSYADSPISYGTEAAGRVAILATTLESLNRFAEHLASEGLRNGPSCEYADYDTTCADIAVAYSWRDGFGDAMCATHAAAAAARGDSIVIYGRRHSGGAD